MALKAASCDKAHSILFRRISTSAKTTDYRRYWICQCGYDDLGALRVSIAPISLVGSIANHIQNPEKYDSISYLDREIKSMTENSLLGGVMIRFFSPRIFVIQDVDWFGQIHSTRPIETFEKRCWESVFYLGSVLFTKRTMATAKKKTKQQIIKTIYWNLFKHFRFLRCINVCCLS